MKTVQSRRSEEAKVGCSSLRDPAERRHSLRRGAFVASSVSGRSREFNSARWPCLEGLLV